MSNYLNNRNEGTSVDPIQQQIDSDSELAERLQFKSDEEVDEILSDYEPDVPTQPTVSTFHDSVLKERSDHKSDSDLINSSSDKFHDIVARERAAEQRELAAKKLEADYTQDRNRANDRATKAIEDYAKERKDRLRAEYELRAEKNSRIYDFDKELRLKNLGLRLIPAYSDIYKRQTMEEKINDLIKKELEKETKSSKEKTDLELINLVKTLLKKKAPKKKSVKKPKKKSVKKPKKKSVKTITK